MSNDQSEAKTETIEFSGTVHFTETFERTAGYLLTTSGITVSYAQPTLNDDKTVTSGAETTLELGTTKTTDTDVSGSVDVSIPGNKQLRVDVDVNGTLIEIPYKASITFDGSDAVETQMGVYKYIVYDTDFDTDTIELNY